jgi:hypothetical protein
MTYNAFWSINSEALSRVAMLMKIKRSFDNMKKCTFMTFCALCLFMLSSAVIAQETEYGHVSGSIEPLEGEVKSGWRVRIFDAKAGPSPFTQEFRRVPDYSARSSYDGSFSARLKEGSYYFMVIKKVPGRMPGPPEVGDYIYPPMDNRAQKPFEVRADETTDIGMISGMVPYKEELALTGMTGIEGSVLDADGNPVAGRLVFASVKTGGGIPLFVSDSETDKDGKYMIRVPEGGQYYLSIWDKDITLVTVRTGELTQGIDLNIPGNR